MRGGILGAVAFVLVMALPISGQGLPSPEASWPEGQTVVELPFVYDQGLVVIPVSLNGSRPLRFVLDSGAPLMVLVDTLLADSLGLEPVTRVPVGGAGDGPSYMAGLALGAAASVGGLEVSEGNVLLGVAAEALPGLDGVIGISLFGNSVVELDWTDQTVRFHEPSTFEYEADGSVLPLTVAQNEHPYIEDVSVSLDGSSWTDVTLHFDVGARKALALDAGEHDDLTIPEGALEGITSFGSLGAEAGHWSRVRGLRLGDHELNEVITAFRGSAPVSGPGVPPHEGTLGVETLDRFHVFVDYLGGRLILESTERLSDPFLFGTTGLQFVPWAPGQRRLKIAYVMEESPAEFAGLREGDEILFVDGIPVSHVSGDEMRESWLSPPGTSMVLGLERDGRDLDVTLITSDLLPIR